MTFEIKKLNGSCGKCYQRETIGKTFGKLKVLKFLGGDGTPNRNASWFLCECECGNQIKVMYDHLTSGHTQSCGCIKNSYGEQLIKNILDDYHINYKQEYKFLDLKDKDFLRFDFAILNQDNNPICLIEFDGPQHIKGNNFTLDNNFDQELLLKHDEMKNTYAKTKNIPLIRIPYKDKTKDKIMNYLKEYLK